MITEKDLQEAIAECLGTRTPNANTCIKLAAFYTIRDQLYPREDRAEPVPSYSYAAPPDSETIKEYGDTPFLKAIAGRNPDEIWPIMDEVMTALMALNRRLYDAAMRKLQ